MKEKENGVIILQKALNQIDDNELDEMLLERTRYRVAAYPVIELNKEMRYRCIEAKIKGTDKIGYFLQYRWWQDDEWTDVTDLTELKIWEYNDLVDELNRLYPEYPIERLDGRFV